MSITIKLDRPALAGMIESDPEFKFELSNAVVSEVIRKVFEKDMARLMKEAEPELFKRAVGALQESKGMEERLRRALDQQLVGRSSWQGMPAMTPAMKEVFDKGVLSAMDRLKAGVDKILNDYVTAQAQELVDAKLAELDIDTRIAKRFDRMLNEEVEKKVLAHHEALLRKMKEALA